MGWLAALLRPASFDTEGESVLYKAIIFGLLLWVVPIRSSPAQDRFPESLYQEVTALVEQGRLLEAEQALRFALKSQADDFRTLGLLATVLDAQKRYGDAEVYYRQALRLAPDSAALLNNLVNHYLAQGDSERARAAFLEVVRIEPGHPNANLQLAALSVSKRQGKAALEYLERLPVAERDAPAAQLLRAKALRLSNESSAAQELLHQLAKHVPPEPQLAFSVGMTYVEWQQFEDAERAFTQALQAEPTNFDVLFNLGLAASRAGHLDRAEQVFQVALKQKPDDAETLYNLARVYHEQGQDEKALPPLLQAQHFAPKRPDILLFIAEISDGLGYYGDAASAFEKYLDLKPNDDRARRERGFALARTARLDEGIRELRWFVEKHPHDAQGLYELGIAETVHDRSKAIGHLNQALARNPNLLAARYARAVFDYQAGNSLQAVKDAKFILEREPRDSRALDILGEAYLQLGQVGEAATTLKHAADLAPGDAKVLTHYSRALVRSGRGQEAAKVLHQLEQLGPGAKPGRPSAGLFNFLGLLPSEQRSRYLAHLQERVQMNPQDAGLRAQLAREQLADGNLHDALTNFSQLRSQTSDQRILADCGKTLLEFEQYEPAREFLARVVAADPSAEELRLDLAIALFHVAGPEAGLSELDKTPGERRRGDYYLLRAQIEDAMDKAQDAAQDLNRGLRSAPTRPDLYFHAALFLIKHHEHRQALDLLEHAGHKFPDQPEILLTRAITSEMLERSEDAQKLLAQIQARWPEWSEPYLINGIILECHFKSAEARPMLETAIALGAEDPLTYYYLALAITHATPEDHESAEKAITEALKRSPGDPFACSLAGKIAYANKDYAAAVDHLKTALRAWPDMIEAHQALSGAYKALGEKEKSVAELKEVLRIKQQSRSADQAPPFPARTLLFSVRPPAISQ